MLSLHFKYEFSSLGVMMEGLAITMWEEYPTKGITLLQDDHPGSHSVHPTNTTLDQTGATWFLSAILAVH